MPIRRVQEACCEDGGIEGCERGREESGVGEFQFRWVREGKVRGERKGRERGKETTAIICTERRKHDIKIFSDRKSNIQLID